MHAPYLQRDGTNASPTTTMVQPDSVMSNPASSISSDGYIHPTTPLHAPSHQTPSASLSSNNSYASIKIHNPTHFHRAPGPTAQVPPLRHEWTETSNATTSRAIDLLVVEIPERSSKRFFCGWSGCKHVVGFVRKVQLLTHIRSVHFHEKLFVCMTWFVSHSSVFFLVWTPEGLSHALF